MTAVSAARKIMTGIKGQSSLQESRLAHKFICLVAHTLTEAWNDPSKFDETCMLLLDGFQRDKLALLAREDCLVILDDQGQTKVKFPVSNL